MNWKEKYIELLKKSDEDICKLCVHYHKCEGEKCEHYEKGVGGYVILDGKEFYNNWEWDCIDFDYGTCPVLENTPCNGCIQGDCDGLELKDNDDYEINQLTQKILKCDTCPNYPKCYEGEERCTEFDRVYEILEGGE